MIIIYIYICFLAWQNMICWQIRVMRSHRAAKRARPKPLRPLPWESNIRTVKRPNEQLYPLAICRIAFENANFHWENPLFLWPWLQ